MHLQLLCPRRQRRIVIGKSERISANFPMRWENRNFSNFRVCNEQFPIWLNEIVQQLSAVTTLISVYVGSETSGLKYFKFPQYNHFDLQVFVKFSCLKCDKINLTKRISYNYNFYVYLIMCCILFRLYSTESIERTQKWNKVQISSKSRSLYNDLHSAVRSWLTAPNLSAMESQQQLRLLLPNQINEEHNIRCNIKLRTRQQTLTKTSFLFVCFIFVLLINQLLQLIKFLMFFCCRLSCVMNVFCYFISFIIAYNYNSTINIIRYIIVIVNSLSLSLSLLSYT